MNNERMVTQAALEPCPFCGGEAELGWHESDCFVIRCKVCAIDGPCPKQDTEAEAIAAWNNRPAAQPEREAALEEALRPFAREARWISDAPDLMNKSWAGTGLSYGDWHRAAAALTTPAPAEDDDPDDHLGGKLAAAVERELDRIEQRNSTRQDFTPAFDRELARKVIMAGFGLFSCRGWTTASGYQWGELLETLGLNKARPVSTAPAVLNGDQP